MSTKDPREPFIRIDVVEAKALLERDDVVIIDVREPHEYAEGHVPDATLLPVNSIFTRKDELPADKEIIFICRSGGRSALAAEMAAATGFANPLYNLEGGTLAWVEAGEPVES